MLIAAGTWWGMLLTGGDADLTLMYVTLLAALLAIGIAASMSLPAPAAPP